LTLNPAIDRTITVDRLAFEDRAYILSSKESAGGRGLVASWVVHHFGGKVRALVTAGGAAGKRLEALVADAGYSVVLTRIANETRTNLTITDKHGLTVNLNEGGPRVSERELKQIESTVRGQLSGVDWLMLCGSLPPGVPHGFYGRMVSVAREKNVKTLVMADGEALREAVEAHPTVATVTQQGAERLLNRALLTHSHFHDAALRIRAMGAETVVLSLGSRGAVAAFARKKTVEAVPPRLESVCPIGSGDALAAAYVWALEEGKTKEDALRWGTAAATASAHLPGMNFAGRKESERVYQEVEIRRRDEAA
jgi:1-phosphofructokinase family hexose kinase